MCAVTWSRAAFPWPEPPADSSLLWVRPTVQRGRRAPWRVFPLLGWPGWGKWAVYVVLCAQTSNPRSWVKTAFCNVVTVFLSRYCVLSISLVSGQNQFFRCHKSPVRPLSVSPLQVPAQSCEEQSLMRCWRRAHKKWELKLVARVRLFNATVCACGRRSAGHVEVFIHYT